jgi:hypothetical protein
MALFNIKFRATTKGAKRSALPIIANDFNKIFRRNKRQLESYAKLTIELALRESETYHSLLGDDLTGLRAELGLTDPLGEVGPIKENDSTGEVRPCPISRSESAGSATRTPAIL